VFLDNSHNNRLNTLLQGYAFTVVTSDYMTNPNISRGQPSVFRWRRFCSFGIRNL